MEDKKHVKIKLVPELVRDVELRAYLSSLGRDYTEEQVRQVLEGRLYVSEEELETYFNTLGQARNHISFNRAVVEDWDEQNAREFKSLMVADAGTSTFTTKQAIRPQPPVSASSIIRLLLEARDREVVIGDLTEDYENRTRECGKLRADLWFYKQVGLSVLPLLRRALLRLRLVRFV